MAFSRVFATDAHFAAYSVPIIERRLDKGALARRDVLPGGVALVLAVFDVDCAEAHETKTEAPATWWAAEREKLATLTADHPAPFVYRTRGGYRVVYRIPARILRSQADADAWKRSYAASRAELARSYEIATDDACCDWTRLYRLPRVRRDGHHEERETLGDPSALGVWSYQPPPEPDRVTERAKVVPIWSAVHGPAAPTRRYAIAALASAASRIESAGRGGRNVMLNAEAYALARFVTAGMLDAGLVERALADAGCAAGLEPGEVEATIRSALGARGCA